jgi:hypothetical protein
MINHPATPHTLRQVETNIRFAKSIKIMILLANEKIDLALGWQVTSLETLSRSRILY